MSNQLNKAQAFRELHQKGNPLVLYNIWDAGSARAIESIGVRAIGTSSCSVAASQGYEDGENIPLSLVLQNVERIMSTVQAPLTVDIEGGYGECPDDVMKTAKSIIDRGVIGVNFEDQVVGGEGLYSVQDQCARIRAIREASKTCSIPIFINARTDLFFKEERDHAKLMDEAFERINEYHKVGADGFFVPGLLDKALIKEICKNSPIPINLMIMNNAPSLEILTDLGVSRISYGPGPYIEMLDSLKSTIGNALMRT